MNQIDFSNAPAGATHYAVKSNGSIYWLRHAFNGFWARYTDSSHDIQLFFVSDIHTSCMMFDGALIQEIPKAAVEPKPAALPELFATPDDATHFIPNEENPLDVTFYKVWSMLSYVGALKWNRAAQQWVPEQFLDASDFNKKVIDISRLKEYRPWQPSDEIEEQVRAFVKGIDTSTFMWSVDHGPDTTTITINRLRRN